jgi:hypothetical protein
MVSPTPPAISWPAPDAPLRDALPGDSTMRCPPISPKDLSFVTRQSIGGEK